MNQQSLPLDDVRVLAIEQFGAGPYGSMQLADLGADVIKIEDPHHGGDVGRYIQPYAEGEDSLYFEALNRGKRSLSLDLAAPAGRDVFEHLVRVCDGVYANLRGDVPAKLGIRYSDLEHLNPQIVSCTLSGFGLTGPRANEPGYDHIVQALAGWMHITGEPDGPPTRTGISLADFTSGIVAAFALLAGIHSARRTGRGCDCDISLFDTAVSLLTYQGVWHLNRDYEPQRTSRSAHPSLVPFQAFQAADGWFVIGCAKEKFWIRLVAAIDREDLGSDPRFATFEQRYTNARVLVAELDTVFRQRNVEHWVSTLTSAGVPCGRVNTVEQAFADPQTIARKRVITADHHRYDRVYTLATPVHVGEAAAPPRAAPRRGEDTTTILQDILGYSSSQIRAAADAGAFGDRGAPTGT